MSLCAWCKNTVADDGSPLKRCGWCRIFFYCSVQCQVGLNPTLPSPRTHLLNADCVSCSECGAKIPRAQFWQRAHWPAHRERCPPRSEPALTCLPEDLIEMKTRCRPPPPKMAPPLQLSLPPPCSSPPEARPGLAKRTERRLSMAEGFIGQPLPEGWKKCSSCRLPVMAAFHECPSCTRPVSESDDDLSPVNFLELRAEAARSGHWETDPQDDLHAAAEEGDMGKAPPPPPPPPARPRGVARRRAPPRARPGRVS